MATAVIMPRQGQSVESCVIGKWHKQVGDKVSVGDTLFTYETDKATFDEEAKAEGTLLAILYEEGDDVDCLKTVCIIGEEGESVDSEELGVRSSPRISPRAKILASKTGVDISLAVPTGAGGRIMEADIQRVLNLGRTATRAEAQAGVIDAEQSADYEVVKLTNVRKVIAKAMHASLSEMAQLTHHTSFDASDILNFRKKLKTLEANPLHTPHSTLHTPHSHEDHAKITITDIIIFAVSRILLKHKSLNAHFLGDKMALFNNTHIGIAVDTPRGLLVPTLFCADTLTLTEIADETKALFDKCKQGSIEPDTLKGASFTISNLGTMGIEMFTPIINPPQTGILGVCSIIERTKDGGKYYPAMGLSLTYDHRALDGADASRFLKDLVTYLEDFTFNLAVDKG